ncbi:MAG: TraR/DksA C4-type zinc finger protein, partial [Chitinophagaceae bacterium]
TPVAAAKPAKKAVKPEAKKPAPKKTIAPKPAPKAAKPAPKPMKKAVPSKPVAKAPAKPVAKPPAKPVTKTPAKPLAKTPAKPVVAAKAPAKPVAKVPVKQEVKVPVKPAPKAALPVKPDAKAPVKPAPAPVKKEAEAVKPSAPKKIETPQSEVVKTAAKLAEIRKAARAQEAKKVQKPVVMPKINATTSRPYQPEFTKSVLDQPNQEYSGPTMRYSDGELVEFRELIARKLEAAKKELSYLHGLITRKDEMSGDETDNRYMTMEDGSLSMEREQLSQMASRQIDFIDKLEKALIRIENKTYGICRVTGKLIDKARLRAVPHATLSMEAKVGMNRNTNVQ